MSSSDVYFIAWTPEDDWSCSFDYSDTWEFESPFKVPLEVLDNITFKEKPLSFVLTRRDRPESRVFVLEDGKLFILAHLIEQLILNGLVLHSNKHTHSLQFARLTTQPFVRPMIELQSLDCQSLPDFWKHVTSTIDTMIVYLDERGLLTKSAESVMKTAAIVSQRMVMEKIDSFFKEYAEHEKVDLARWNGAFDTDGKITDENLFTNIYHAGIDTEILSEAIPFMVGLFDKSSSAKERKDLLDQLTVEFKIYEQQLDSLLENQIKRNRMLMFPFRVISHDIARVDRSIPGFGDPQALGNIWSAKLLKMYCLYNPSVTYHQGMNDLLQPLFLVFFRSFDFDNPERNPDPEPLLVKTFWCFDSMLRQTNRFDILANTQDECKNMARQILSILNQVTPAFVAWLKITGLSKLMWMYSDFVVLYKRTFKDIWKMWTQFNCSPEPSQWIAYFSAAILLLGFCHIVETPDSAMSVLMETFPRCIQTVDRDLVARTALWLYMTAKIEQHSTVELENYKECATDFEIGFK